MHYSRPLAAVVSSALVASSAFFVPTLADATPAPAPTAAGATPGAPGSVTGSGNVSLVAQEAEVGSDDPALQQSVDAAEQIAPEGESVVFEDGHADMGPMIVDNSLTFLVRDDRETTPVWRHPEDIVFALGDSASQELPADGQYDFTGASGGDKVWLVPQTQKQDVPWLGWNTQAPSIVETADRGVTLEYLGHQGPGQFSVFLQNGGFGEPQQLWNSGSEQKQSTWVDLNTHTHANWVFTEPGVHLVAMNVKVAQVDGTEVSDTALLRFAVGGADPAEAAAAEWDGDINALAGTEAQQEESSNSSSSVVLWVAGGLIVVAAVLVGLGLRNRRAGARRKAAARKGSGE